MAYLGAQPNKTLTKTTSQSFNGTGSATVFTLNRAVNTEEELEVFVENVQQEPGSGKSYTASGTTLTFDEAPPSGTGNVYVIYRGQAEVTTRLEHDANQALSATTGTFSGDLTVDTNTLHVDSTNNRVGVGTTAPGVGLEVTDSICVGRQAAAAQSKFVGIGGSGGTFVTGTTGGGYIEYEVKSDQDTLIHFITNDQGNSHARRVSVLAAGGLAFNGDTAAANALDDYEEGTWTPAFDTTGTGFSSVGYHHQKARYVKVGRQVHTWFLIATNALTKGSASSSIVVTGLPYTVENVDYQSGVVGYSSTWVSNHPISLLGSTNQTKLFLYYTNGSAHVNMTPSNMADHSGNNKHFVYAALSYRAA